MPETEAIGAKALEFAESLGDTEYQLRALYGLWACRINSGQCRVGLTLAQRFYSGRYTPRSNCGMRKFTAKRELVERRV